MSIARTTSIISPVASALDTAHVAGLLHRDVKPANILIDARPRRPEHVYLSDFGLAKSTTSAATLTGTGRFLGTVDYMSPEQLQAKAVDGRTDQYALACTAFERRPTDSRAAATSPRHCELSQDFPPISQNPRPAPKRTLRRESHS